MDLQHLRASDGTGEAVLAHIMSPRTPGATVLDLDNVDNWNSKVIVVTGTPAANGFIAAAGMKVMYGSIIAGDLNIAGFAPGYVDNGNTTSEVAIVKMTTNWADALVDILKQTLADNGKIKTDGIDSASMFADAVDPVLRLGEGMPDFVASGGGVASVSGLTGSMSNIVYYIKGARYTISSIPNKVYTASKDTYVDVNTSGAVVYTEVANGAASPALAANHKRIARVITGGAAITWIQRVGYDSLGNRYYNTVSIQADILYMTSATTNFPNNSDVTNVTFRFQKPRDIMTVANTQEVRAQFWLLAGGTGNVVMYRDAYLYRLNTTYLGVEPTSGTTVGPSANYQTFNINTDNTVDTYWAQYDFSTYAADSTLRCGLHRDGAAGADVNPGVVEVEDFKVMYNRDYTKSM